MLRPRRLPSLAATALALLIGGPLSAVSLVVLTAPSAAGATMVVHPGDTLWQIASDHHVGVADLAAANGMDANDVLFAGRRITIPERTSTRSGRTAAGGGTGGAGAPAPPPSPQSAAASGGAEVGSAQPVHGAGAVTPGRLAQQRQFCAQAAGPSSAYRGQLPDQLRGAPSRLALRPRFDYWSRVYGVPAELVEAVAWQESGWQNRVVSRTGAMGIGQLMPATVVYVGHQLLGVKLNPAVPDDNIRMSARLLAQLLAANGGSLCPAIASYYEGPDLLQRAGVLRETQPYVKNVLALLPRFVQVPGARAKK